MVVRNKGETNRYVNDLRRFSYSQSQVIKTRSSFLLLGLALFGPKLIATVGEKITRLNSPRAYCVALSSAVTVLIATYFGLPVSSTHIAIVAIFGVGFLRELLEAPKRKNKASSKADVYRKPRQLVRRRFVFSIAAAWVITVPASAFLSASIYFFLNLL